MAEQAIPRTRDTTGTLDQFDTYALANGNLQQGVAIGNGQANNLVTGVEPWGSLDTYTGPFTLFYDTFVGPLDTTDKWTVTGGAPTFSTGTLAMPATASTYNAIRTKDAVRANAGRTYVANGIAVETGTTTGAGRFWGLGTTATTPAAAVLVQDGIGFEIDQATGALLAVTYAAGVRTTVATLTKPTDGAVHRYAMFFRVTDAQWFVDNMSVPVATASFPNVVVPEVPALIVRQNASSFTGTPVFTVTAHLTGDTSRQGVSAVDPVIGTRQQRVDAVGAATVAPRRSVPTRAMVTPSASSATLLAANPYRGGWRLDNSLGTTDVVVGEDGSAVTATSYTLRIPQGLMYESPAGYVSSAAITFAGLRSGALFASVIAIPVTEF